MSIGVPQTTLLDQIKHQIDSGEYRGALSTYRDFRDSVPDCEHDPGRLRMVDDAETAARDSFRTGAVGFESQMNTLVFVARRLIEEPPKSA